MPASNIWTNYVISRIVEELGWEQTRDLLRIMEETNPESNEVVLTVRALKAVFASYPSPVYS